MGDRGGVGAYLVARRIALGLTAEELARETRIAPRVLRALEEDRLDDLPAPVYVRGYVRACCARLGEAPEAALARYQAQLAARRGAGAEPLPVLPTAPVLSTVRRGSRRPASLGAAALATGAAAVLVGLAAHRLGPLAGHGAAGGPGSPSILEQVGAGTGGPVVPPPDPAGAPAPAGGIAAAGGGARPARVLVLRAAEPTWVRVTPEDARPTEELLVPGAVREWRSAGRFTVTLGNAGGVRIELDGEPVTPLGSRGEVVRDVTLPREPAP